ncbi:MAG: PilW family protein [Candidatus Kerfeldbacteria bacterium]
MKIKQQQGITMIETLVYLALVSGILLAATSFAWNIINNRTKAFSIQEVEQNGRFITQKIAGVIKEANAITFPLVGNTASNLDLEMNDGGTQTISINLNGDDLEWQEDAGPTVLLNSNQVRITSMDFVNMSSTNNRTQNIKLVMIIEHVNPAGRTEYEFTEDFETTIELRDQ